MMWLRVVLVCAVLLGVFANDDDNCAADSFDEQGSGCSKCMDGYYLSPTKKEGHSLFLTCLSCSQGPCTLCANYTSDYNNVVDVRCSMCQGGWTANTSQAYYGCHQCQAGCINCEHDTQKCEQCNGPKYTLDTVTHTCNADYDDGNGPDPKVVLAIVAGVVVVVLLICLCCCQRRRQRRALERKYLEQVELNKKLQADHDSVKNTKPTPAPAPALTVTVPTTPTGPPPAYPYGNPAPSPTTDSYNNTSKTMLDAPTVNSVYAPPSPRPAALGDDRTLPTSRSSGYSPATPRPNPANNNYATSDVTSRSGFGGPTDEDSTVRSANGGGTGRVGGTKGGVVDQTTMMRSAAPTTMGLDTTISTLQFKQKGNNQAFSFTIDASAVKLVPMDDLQMGAKLGSGGFGTVHRVTQKSTYTEMALKVFPEVQTADEVEQFVREASVLLNLHHPHCLACLGVVINGNELAILTEFMDGGDLSAAMNKGALTRADKIKALRDVAKGLAYLHGSGITHADLKPSNVLLDGRGRAVLGDFGLAGMTKALGYTERYAAPEVLLGGLPDTCSDVYSFGIVILAVLTGTPPFAYLPASEARITRDVYQLPGRLSEDYPQELREVVNASFANEPTRRPHISALTKALVECN